MVRSSIIWFFIIACLLVIPLSSAAHFIAGYVGDSLDGVANANDRAVVVWNPAVGISDNLTEIIGPNGNSTVDNVYLVDCEELSAGCSFGDELRAKVFDNGSGYFTGEAALNVTGGGFDTMPNLTLNSRPDVALVSPANDSLVSGAEVNFTCSVGDLDGDLANVTLYGNWTGGWHANQTVSVSGANSTANFSANLSDGAFEWNCLVEDVVGLSQFADANFTFRYDGSVPLISFASPYTPDNATYAASLTVNVSVTEANFANITYELFNSTGLFNRSVFTSLVTSLNFSNIVSGNYTYNVSVYDLFNNFNSTETRTVFVDADIPLISFTDGTEANGTEIEQNFIFANVSYTETNLVNITYELFNETDLVNRSVFNITFNGTIHSINWTDLSSVNVTYFYNVSIIDIAGSVNNTETRTIELIDGSFPGLTLVAPQNITYNINVSLPLVYTVDELNPDTCWYNVDNGPNITLSNCDSSSFDVSDESSHTLRLYLNDTFGNINETAVTFYVNTSLVFTDDWLVQRGTSTTNGQGIFGIPQAIDTSKSFILHTARSSDSSPNALQVTGTILNSTAVILENFAGADAVVEWEVITGPNITVQRQENAYDTTNSSFNITLDSSVNVSQSFIIVSNRLDTGTNSQNIRGLWTGSFVNDTVISLQRGITDTAGTVSWQVVEWRGANVRNGSLSSTALTAVESFDPEIVVNQSFLIFSKRMTGSATGLNDINVGGTLLNETSALFYRQDTGTTMFAEWFVVESNLLRTQREDDLLSGSTGPFFSGLQEDLINTSRSFNRPSWDSSGGGNAHANGAVTSNITNETTIEFDKGTANQDQNVSWQVMELIEIEKPVISLVYPGDFANFSTLTIEHFNYSVNDSSVVSNCSLFGNWTGAFHSNQTVESIQTEVDQNFSSVTVEGDGSYVWNVACTDVYGNAGTNATNFTFTTDTTSPTISLTELNSTHACELVEVNCSVSDALTGVDEVFIEARAPTFSLNYTAQNISDGIYGATISLNESGTWNFTCIADDFVDNHQTSDLANGTAVNPADLTLNSSDIVFSEASPIEGQSIQINATIHNIGCFDANDSLVGFFAGDPDVDGVQIAENQTINVSSNRNETVNVTWTTVIGTTNIFSIADINDSINELNETNNEANRTINLTAWQDFYGNVTADVVLSNANLSNLTLWFNDTSSTGNVFVVDSESSILWTSVLPLGQNVTGDNTTNDFSEVDALLNMTAYEDSLSNLFTTDGAILRNTTDLLVHQTILTEVPIVRSTITDSFITGVLWDSSDDSADGEFSSDDEEDLIFVSPINRSRTGAYGLYDYEITIPARLREYHETDTQQVFFYFDLS